MLDVRVDRDQRHPDQDQDDHDERCLGRFRGGNVVRGLRQVHVEELCGGELADAMASLNGAQTLVMLFHFHRPFPREGEWMWRVKEKTLGMLFQTKVGDGIHDALAEAAVDFLAVAFQIRVGETDGLAHDNGNGMEPGATVAPG